MSPCFFISMQVFLFSTLPQLSSYYQSTSGLNCDSYDSLVSFQCSASASLIVVMSLKWIVLGILRHFMPQVCLHSWKCIQNARRPQQLKFPHISHLYYMPRPCSLQSQQGMGLPSQPNGRFLGLQIGASASSLSDSSQIFSSIYQYPRVCFFLTKFIVSQMTLASSSLSLDILNQRNAIVFFFFSYSYTYFFLAYYYSYGLVQIYCFYSDLCFFPMRCSTQLCSRMNSFLQQKQQVALCQSKWTVPGSHPAIFPAAYFYQNILMKLFVNASIQNRGRDRFKNPIRQSYSPFRYATYLCQFLNFLLIRNYQNRSKCCRNHKQSCNRVVSLLSSITLHMLRNYKQIVCMSTYLPLLYSIENQGYLKGGRNTFDRKYSTVLIGVDGGGDESFFLNWSLIYFARSQKFCQITSAGFFLSDGFKLFWPQITIISSFFIACQSLMKLRTSLDFWAIINAKLLMRFSEMDFYFGLSCMESISLTIAFYRVSIDQRLKRSSQRQVPCILLQFIFYNRARSSGKERNKACMTEIKQQIKINHQIIFFFKQNKGSTANSGLPLPLFFPVITKGLTMDAISCYLLQFPSFCQSILQFSLQSSQSSSLSQSIGIYRSPSISSAIFFSILCIILSAPLQCCFLMTSLLLLLYIHSIPFSVLQNRQDLHPSMEHWMSEISSDLKFFKFQSGVLSIYLWYSLIFQDMSAQKSFANFSICQGQSLYLTQAKTMKKQLLQLLYLPQWFQKLSLFYSLRFEKSNFLAEEMNFLWELLVLRLYFCLTTRLPIQKLGRVSLIVDCKAKLGKVLCHTTL